MSLKKSKPSAKHRRTWRHLHLAFHPHPASHDGQLASNAHANRLILQSASRDPSEPSDVYISLLSNVLQSKLDRLGQEFLSSFLPDGEDGVNPRNWQDQLDKLLNVMIQQIKDDGAISIDRHLTKLVEAKVVKSSTNESSERNAARKFIFAALGWMSFLFVAVDPDGKQDRIETSSESALLPVRTLQDIVICRRPLPQLIRAFEDILPDAICDSRLADHRSANDGLAIDKDSEDNEDKLHVSLVNASTLTRIGGIKIIWVQSIGSHLHFDPKGPYLKIFALPSVCKVYQNEGSLLASIIRGMHTSVEMPETGLRSVDLLREIEHSYGLLFRDDANARNHYIETETSRALIEGYRDPALDELCGANATNRLKFWSNNAVRESYSARDEFPILSKRLLRIQRYSKSIRTNRISSLWNDKRNLLQWYTFWAVFWIGGIGIILSTLQLVVAAIQTAYTIKAYKAC